MVIFRTYTKAVNGVYMPLKTADSSALYSFCFFWKNIVPPKFHLPSEKGHTLMDAPLQKQGPHCYPDITFWSTAGAGVYEGQSILSAAIPLLQLQTVN